MCCNRLGYCNIKITPTTTGDQFNSEFVMRNSELKGLRRVFYNTSQLATLTTKLTTDLLTTDHRTNDRM